MRNILLGMVLAAGLTAGTAHAEDMTTPAFQACMDGGDGSTNAMIECIGTEHKIWDKRLNAAYQGLMKVLPKDRKENLQKAQRKWIEYRDLHVAFFSKNPDGGTMARVEANMALMQSTLNRAIELEVILESQQM